MLNVMASSRAGSLPQVIAFQAAKLKSPAIHGGAFGYVQADQGFSGRSWSPTLRQPKSRRFAVGTLFENRDGTYGFFIPSDDNRKIYLAEKFFLPRLDHYRK